MGELRGRGNNRSCPKLCLTINLSAQPNLATNATCHFAGFFSQPRFCCFFVLFTAARDFAVASLEPACRGVLGQLPYLVWLTHLRTSLELGCGGECSPLRRAPFSPQSRAAVDAADAAPRLGHVTSRGGLSSAARSVFFLPRVQWAPCGPTPSLVGAVYVLNVGFYSRRAEKARERKGENNNLQELVILVFHLPRPAARKGSGLRDGNVLLQQHRVGAFCECKCTCRLKSVGYFLGPFRFREEYIYKCMYVCTSARARVCIYVCLLVSVRVRACERARACVYTYMRALCRL